MPTNPAQTSSIENRFRLRQLHTQPCMRWIDADLLHQQALEAGEDQVHGEHISRPLPAGANRPQQAKQRAGRKGFV
ncbi:MAG: hypothetical protein WDO12_02855 [Pseudomonadota bacterium]